MICATSTKNQRWCKSPFTVLFPIAFLWSQTKNLDSHKMKKMPILALAVILLCSAFTVLNEPSKDILGIWKIDESSVVPVTRSIIAVTKKTNPDLAAQLEGQEDVVKDLVRTMTFEYKADNTYAITTPQGPQNGKWTFVENNKYLLISREGRPDRKDSVLEISSTRLHVINRERGDTTLYIRP